MIPPSLSRSLRDAALLYTSCLAGNPLAQMVFRSRFSRNSQTETWEDVVLRVVLGNASLDPRVSPDELLQLFASIYSGQILPPGRALWTGGVPGIPVDARLNCYAVKIKCVDDFAWIMSRLMLGGGVGAAIDEAPWRLGRVQPSDNSGISIYCSLDHTDSAGCAAEGGPCILPVVHASAAREPNPKHSGFRPSPVWLNAHLVDDTRAGWCSALTHVVNSAFLGKPVCVDVSPVRPHGAPLKTFGGTASGPAPLVALLCNAYRIVRSKAGTILSSVDVGDIINFIGSCVQAGGARRSALLLAGGAHDLEFRMSKNHPDAILSHRYTSNNSHLLHTMSDVENFDYEGTLEHASRYGDPGILNIFYAKTTSPDAVTTNPCGEIFLADYDSCNLAEFFPSKMLPGTIEKNIRLITRFAVRQRIEPMQDPLSESARIRYNRLGVAIGGVCDMTECTPQQLVWYKHVVRDEANRYCQLLGLPIPETVTTVKPSGTISLLNSSSPGMHAPFAPYYLRAVMLQESDPTLEHLMASGYPTEVSVYNSKIRNVLFPCKSAIVDGPTQVTETLASQMDRLVALQRWYSDNSVSCTLFYAAHQTRELARLIKYNIHQIKSVAYLRTDHQHTQAPYRAITATEYARVMSGIRTVREDTSSQVEVDFVECEVGSCPVR